MVISEKAFSHADIVTTLNKYLHLVGHPDRWVPCDSVMSNYWAVSLPGFLACDKGKQAWIVVGVGRTANTLGTREI